MPHLYRYQKSPSKCVIEKDEAEYITNTLEHISQHEKVNLINHSDNLSRLNGDWRNVQYFNFTDKPGNLYINITYSNCVFPSCYIWDTESGSRCEVSMYVNTKSSNPKERVFDFELYKEKIHAAIDRMYKKLEKVRQRKEEKNKKAAKKKSQKETFEYMVKEMGLGHRVTLSRTARSMKVQVNSDIDKMKKIFGILADMSEEDVENLYQLASVR
jgi:hypothetical protein